MIAQPRGVPQGRQPRGPVRRIPRIGRLGLPRIDFHLHLFSRVYFEALAGLSPQPGSVEERLARVCAKTGIELPAGDLDAHVRRWLDSMDAHGVERAAAFASLPQEVDPLLDLRRRSGDRLVPFALVDPRAPDCAAKLERIVSPTGFGGVLLFPALHHYRVGDPTAAASFAALEAHRAIAYVHCGALVVKLRDLLGFPRTADLTFANPLDLIPLANAHRETTFVIPHFGAGFLRETLMVGAQCENVVVDTSSSNSWLATDPAGLRLEDVFARALAVFGAERVLFGTDSNTFPKGWQRARYDEQRAILERLAVPAAAQEAIFGGNAARLFARLR